MKIREVRILMNKQHVWLIVFLLCTALVALCAFVVYGRSADRAMSVSEASEEVGQFFIQSQTPFASSTRVITLQAGEGVEYKLDIDKGKAFVYSWSASSPVYYDLHAEPTSDDGEAFLPLKSYAIDTTDQSSGQLVTEFTGNYGWYWVNQSHTPLTITVAVAGFYKRTGIMTGGHSIGTNGI